MAKQADTDAPYSPPLTLTPALLNRVAVIAEALGRWSARQDALPSPRLRRESRELEFIHPFADGNGRLSRIWQTLILSRWNPLLAWLPIEEVIRSRQQDYYESLGQADQQGDLAPFVAYQLEAIHEALRSEIGSEMRSEIDAVILRDLAAEPTLSARRLAERHQLSQRAVEKHLAVLQQKGHLLRHGSPRAGYWQVL